MRQPQRGRALAGPGQGKPTYRDGRLLAACTLARRNMAMPVPTPLTRFPRRYQSTLPAIKLRARLPPSQYSVISMVRLVCRLAPCRNDRHSRRSRGLRGVSRQTIAQQG
jgi:hypothetical protein